MILFYVVCSIFVLWLLVGTILENSGYYQIPEDQLVKRYLKLVYLRNKRNKR